MENNYLKIVSNYWGILKYFKLRKGGVIPINVMCSALKTTENSGPFIPSSLQDKCKSSSNNESNI